MFFLLVAKMIINIIDKRYKQSIIKTSGIYIKEETMKGLKKVLMYAEEHKKKLYLSLCLIFLSVIIGIIPYLLLYKLLRYFLEDSYISLKIALFLSAGMGITLYLKNWFLGKGLTASHDVAYDTLMGMRIKFASKLIKLPMGDIQGNGIGAYKKNFVDDIEQVEILLAHMIPEGIPYLLSPVVVFTTLFIVDWRLALLSMGSIPFGLIPITLMLSSGVKKMKIYYESEREMNKTIVEYISGMAVIKIFNRTTSSFDKYVKNVENYRDFTLDWLKSSWTYMALYTAVLPCTIILLLPVGLIFYVNGTLQLGRLIFSLLLTMSIGLPLVKLMEFMPNIPNLSYKINELEKTFESSEIIAVDKGETVDGYDVTFENVIFSYEHVNVIDQVSFTAYADSTTAIVGESGSGKSTLAKLLVHYWDVGSGSIKIGGVDIRNLSMDHLMDMVSYVSQDTFLFNIPIIDNIRIGNPNASDKEVYNASKAAQCHDFIIELKDGYKTTPGDCGDKLSGGEKQRITIARAILKNAPIVVLDEATSSTDAENEDKIQDALSSLISGKTLIVIAHHLSTIVNSDKVVVLKKGKLQAEGRHMELMKSSIEYRKLWNISIESSNWDLNVKEVENAEYSEKNY